MISLSLSSVDSLDQCLWWHTENQDDFIAKSFPIGGDGPLYLHKQSISMYTVLAQQLDSVMVVVVLFLPNCLHILLYFCIKLTYVCVYAYVGLTPGLISEPDPQRIRIKLFIGFHRTSSPWRCSIVWSRGTLDAPHRVHIRIPATGGQRGGILFRLRC